ncbi:hypothetical protein [Prosthecomicrobium sp. N25]|uniref:hypothetical protein n=1 Tax=Prosthecomicrobium sp. N25 TaxID=3129254 RepID=UPI0030781A2E
MLYLRAFLAGLAAAVLCYGAAVGGGLVLAEWLRVSDHEGGLGLGLAFFVGPSAALLGMVVAIPLALRWRGEVRGFFATLWRTVVVGAAVLAVVPAGILGYELLTPSTYITTSGPEPLLDLEIRLPPDAFVPADPKLVTIRLDTDKSQHDAVLQEGWRRSEDGRIVLSGQIPMYFRTAQRFVSLRLPLTPDRVFPLKLRADPRGATEFGPWQAAVEVFDPGAERGRKPKPEEAAEIRYRVVPRWRPS